MVSEKFVTRFLLISSAIFTGSTMIALGLIWYLTIPDIRIPLMLFVSILPLSFYLAR